MIRLFINILAFVREWLFGHSDSVRKSKNGPVVKPTNGYKQIAIVVLIFASLFANWKLGSMFFRHSVDIAALKAENKEMEAAKARIEAVAEMNTKLIQVISEELTCNGKTFEIIQRAQDLNEKLSAEKLLPPKTKTVKEATTKTVIKNGTTTVVKEETTTVVPHEPPVKPNKPGVDYDTVIGSEPDNNWPPGFVPPPARGGP